MIKTRSKKHIIALRVSDLVKKRLDRFSAENEIPVTNIVNTAIITLIHIGLEKIKRDYYFDATMMILEKAEIKNNKEQK